MKSDLQHPPLILAALAAVSGTLGSHVQGPSYGNAPDLGLYMVLTGVWFGLVVGFGVWRWGGHSWGAAALALVATWVGWELAVNLAMQLEGRWLKATVIPAELTIYISGFAAGAVGALSTWAGAAAFTPALRRTPVPVGLVSTGAVFGLLLPLTNTYDNAAILLLPWQTAIAARLGLGLRPKLMLGRNDAALRTDGPPQSTQHR